MTEASSRWFWLRVVASALLFAGAAFFLHSIGSLVKLLIIAAILAYITNPLVNALESRGLGRTLATAVIFLGILLLLTLFVLLLLPHLTGELRAFKAGFSTGHASEMLQRLEANMEKRFAFMGVENLNIMERVRATFENVGKQLFSYLIDAASILTNLILIPFFMFFLLKDGRRFNKKLIAAVPNRYFEIGINLQNKMDYQLGNYVRGQFIESLIITFLAFGALSLLGVKYALVLGIFVGLTNLIPYLGPVIGAVPPLIVVLYDTGDFASTVYVALALLVIQLFDAFLIKPMVIAKSVNMHPMAVLIVVLVGGKFFGVLGMLLSVPFTAVLQLLLSESMVVIKKYRFS